MTRWSHLFVGRETELDALKAAWRRAEAGVPQVVPIIAESGFGKTRLAQEFFNWLSTVKDGVGGDGYWPDRLVRLRDNLQENPTLSECAQDGRAMPFLWWGLRLVDPGERNQIVTTALRPGEEFLKAHLAAYVKAIKLSDLRRRQALAGGKDAADLAIDLVGLVPGISTVFSILSIGKTAVEGGAEALKVQGEINRLREQDATPAGMAAGHKADLVDLIVSDLRRVAKAPPAGMEPIPVVLLFDDFQWARMDDALCALVGQVLTTAGREGWPLLVLVTSWEQEWRRNDAVGVARLIEAPGVEVRPLNLNRASDLDSLVRAAFPGLTDQQVTLLVERADGNPRFLDALLHKLDTTAALFVGRDKVNALTSEGESQVSRESFETVVRERLQNAPPSVQGALGAASLQGIRFSASVVEATASALGLPDPRDGLSQAETPYAFVAREGQDTNEFRARAYQDAARANLANLVDMEAAEQALRTALANVAAPAGNDPDSDEILEARLALFESPSPDEQSAAFAALANLIRRAKGRLDYRTTQRLSEMWATRWLREGGHQAEAATNDMFAIFQALCDVGRLDLAQGVAESLVWNKRRQYLKEQTPDRMMYLSEALMDLGALIRQTRGARYALDTLNEAAGLAEAAVKESPTLQRRAALTNAHERLGDVLWEIEGHAKALHHYRKCLDDRRALTAEGYKFGDVLAVNLALARVSNAVEQIYGAAEALGLAYERVKLDEALFAENPLPGVRRALAQSFGALSRALGATGRPDEAQSYRQRSLDMQVELMAQLGTPGSRADHASALDAMGLMVEKNQGPEMAAPYYRKALAVARELEAENWPGAELDALTYVRHLAVATGKSAGWRSALPYFQQRLERAEKMAAGQETLKSLRNLALAHAELAGAYRSLWSLGGYLKHAWAGMRIAHKLGTALGAKGWSISEVVKATRGGWVPDSEVKGEEPEQLDEPEGTPRSGPADLQERQVEAPAPSPIDADSSPEGPVARNAPCPCGSGRRYKHCHGAL